jgi:hypothetical protein
LDIEGTSEIFGGTFWTFKGLQGYLEVLFGHLRGFRDIWRYFLDIEGASGIFGGTFWTLRGLQRYLGVLFGH